MSDYINRIDAIHAITAAFDELLSVADAVEILDKLPAADVVERKRGKWIGGELGYCSCCGHEGCASDIWTGCEENQYCPNCGADMRGEDDGHT